MPTTGWWPGTRWKSTSNSKPTARSEPAAAKGKVKTKNPETRRERRKKSEETEDSEGVPGKSKSIAIREDIDPMTSFFYEFLRSLRLFSSDSSVFQDFWFGFY